MGKNARQIAMEILVRMQRDAAYSNLTLDAALRRNELPARDAALVSALVYGVEERLYTIDYQLSLYLKQPLKKLKPEVLAALLAGARVCLERRALEYRLYRRTAPPSIYRRCLSLERQLREMGICVAGTGGR